MAGALAGPSDAATLDLARPVIVNYHVGKTGGTSLLEWLLALRHRAKLWTHYGPGYHVLGLGSDRGPRIGIQNANVIMGHFRPNSSFGSFGEALRSAGLVRRFVHWTVLREPLSRVSSALAYMYPRRNESFLADCVGASRRHAPGPCLSGRGRHVSLRNEYCATFSPRAPHWNKYSTGKRAAWDAFCDVEAAKRQLGSLGAIAFFEDGLGETARAWARLLGLPARAAALVPHANPSPGGHSYSRRPAALRRLIELHNQRDVELYRWARQRQPTHAATLDSGL